MSKKQRFLLLLCLAALATATPALALNCSAVCTCRTSCSLRCFDPQGEYTTCGIFGVCIALTDRYRHVKMPLIARKWYDVLVRAVMVACLVAAVVGLSGRVGPIVTGLLAVYPIVMTSLMLIFQPRVGGPATAALIANTMWGLVGFSACLFTVHLATVPLGSWLGLILSLVVSVVWNIALYGLRRRALLRR